MPCRKRCSGLNLFYNRVFEKDNFVQSLKSLNENQKENVHKQPGNLRRRDFFKALAAGGAVGASLAACSDSPEKLIPYLTPPNSVEYSPGNPIEYATTCMECSAHCGMLVRTREGRAVKAEGNPDHPLNQGRLCIRGQASLQTHYNPARFRGALRRDAFGRHHALSWEKAEADFAKALEGVEARSELVLMTNNPAGSRGAFLDRWLGAVGGMPKLVFERIGLESLRKANELSFGRAEVPEYRIEKAQLLLGFGADFLETWLNPVENAQRFAKMHSFDDLKRQNKGRFVHIGAHRGLTGANADNWTPIRPGTEGVVALYLANAILKRRGQNFPADIAADLRQKLGRYTLDVTVKESGAKKSDLQWLTERVASTERVLAIGGGVGSAHAQSAETQVALNVLNYVTGAVGSLAVFGVDERAEHRPVSTTALLQLIERMERGEVKVLVLDGANPLYQLPGSARFASALDKVKTIVSLSSISDETSARAHIVLPSSTFMERWGDASPRTGVYSLIQPVMAPVFGVKAAEDTLLSVARLVKRSAVSPLAETTTYKAFLQNRWRRIQTQSGDSQPFTLFWREALQRGGVFNQKQTTAQVTLQSGALSQLPKPLRYVGKGLMLLPIASLRHGQGEGATNPWLQEIPDPISQVTWNTWLDIHPETATSLGLRDGDLARITTQWGQLELPARLHYGIHRQAIGIPIGLGRENVGKVADFVGGNVFHLLPVEQNTLSGEMALITTKAAVTATGKRAFNPSVSGSPRQLDRGIIQTQTLAQAKKGEAPAGHHGGHERERDFYPKRAKQTAGYHDPYRWGMVVDVDRCTGCSACVAACYAENNIPVVGRERVGLGREMSWIQVQRFIEGEGDDTTTLMQPMMCQQCGNAGCEAVCPVYATYHNPEGLNAQIYNRCVGTRYCSNNCAYKVRRFNWFQYEWDAPLNLQLNPDVSVRSKGVMEKCTFCVQRLRRARQLANDQGREVADGEATPACVQTCPTGALTFGNLADANSEVSRKALAKPKQKKERVRQYEVLEELRQLPAVTYLRKVTHGPLPQTKNQKNQRHG